VRDGAGCWRRAPPTHVDGSFACSPTCGRRRDVGQWASMRSSTCPFPQQG
jgi:hypothetical protein